MVSFFDILLMRSAADPHINALCASVAVAQAISVWLILKKM